MNKAQAKELAVRALQAAIDGDWQSARQALLAIGQDGAAISYALVAWCDTAVIAQDRALGRDTPGPGGTERFVRPGWLDPETGRLILNADELPPAAQWSGRVLAARAAMDHDQFRALVCSMPADGFERGEYAAVLLTGCAGIISLAMRHGGVS